MPIKTVKPSRTEVESCVVRYADMRGTDRGFPDSELPGCHRWLYNFMGFAPPQAEGVQSPVGADAAPYIKHVQAGFGIAFVKATPGNGVPFHTHDTNETFMCLEGRWRCEWEGEAGVESIELGKYDLISFQPGIQRRFESVEEARGGGEAVLLGVVGGDAPQAEYSPESVEMLVRAGKLPPPVRDAA